MYIPTKKTSYRFVLNEDVYKRLQEKTKQDGFEYLSEWLRSQVREYLKTKNEFKINYSDVGIL